MSNEVPALAKAFPPGYFIREELEFRGWSQRHLADEMGRPLQIVNGIINGHRMITPETATQLQKVFGSSAIYWMNLETIWQLYKLNEKKKLVAKAKRTVARRPSPLEKVSARSEPDDSDSSEASETLKTKREKTKAAR